MTPASPGPSGPGGTLGARAVIPPARVLNVMGGGRLAGLVHDLRKVRAVGAAGCLPSFAAPNGLYLVSFMSAPGGPATTFSAP